MRVSRFKRGWSMWSFLMLKGGVGKSKSAAYVATELARRGDEVLLIDGDPNTQGLTDHVTRLELDYPDYMIPWHFAQWTPADGVPLVRFVPAQVERTGARRVVLDMASERYREAARAAMLSDLVLVPAGPWMEEQARIQPTMDVIRPHIPMDLSAVLLNRVDRPGIGHAATYRASLTTKEPGRPAYQVLRTEVLKHRLYDTFGGPIIDTGSYVDVVDEMLMLEANYAPPA